MNEGLFYKERLIGLLFLVSGIVGRLENPDYSILHSLTLLFIVIGVVFLSLKEFGLSSAKGEGNVKKNEKAVGLKRQPEDNAVALPEMEVGK